MRFYFSHVTVPGIIYYIENARGCTASTRYCDAIQPRLFCGLVPSAEETRPRAPYPYPPHREGALTDGRSPSLVRPWPGRPNRYAVQFVNDSAEPLTLTR